MKEALLRPVPSTTLRPEDVIGDVTKPPQYKTVWESGGKAPFILGVDVSLSLVVRFMHCSLKAL